MPTYTASPYPVASRGAKDAARTTKPHHRAARGRRRTKQRPPDPKIGRPGPGSACAWARLELRGLFDDFVGLDHVVGLELVPARDHHAALVAVRDLADVVLEAPQAADLAFVDLDGIADDPQVRFASDLALVDHAASDRADLGDRERVA